MSFGKRIKYIVCAVNEACFSENSTSNAGINEPCLDTSNSSMERKVRKRTLMRSGKIHCDYCQFHRGENRSQQDVRDLRSWKSQYRTRKGIVCQSRKNPRNICPGFYVNPNDLDKLSIPFNFDWSTF